MSTSTGDIIPFIISDRWHHVVQLMMSQTWSCVWWWAAGYWTGTGIWGGRACGCAWSWCSWARTSAAPLPSSGASESEKSPALTANNRTQLYFTRVSFWYPSKGYSPRALVTFKGIVHTKMLLFYVEHKRRYLKECSHCSFSENWNAWQWIQDVCFFNVTTFDINKPNAIDSHPVWIITEWDTSSLESTNATKN